MVVFFAASPSLYSQQPSFKCTKLTTDNGLSDNMVFCALQDRYGFMWFGTRDGLNKYDGHKFTVYRHNPKDSNSLSDDAISSLYENSNGDLWVGTHTGYLNKFDRKTQRFRRYNLTTKNNTHNVGGEISSICEDSDGNLWLTTSPPNTGLRKLYPNTGQVDHYVHDPLNPYSLSSNLASAICRDSSGTLWVGTRYNGLNRYDKENNRFINYRVIPKYGFNQVGEIVNIQALPNEGFLICDTTSILKKIIVQSHNIIRQDIPILNHIQKSDHNIRAILKDSFRYYWVGIRNAGLYLVDQFTFHAVLIRQIAFDQYSLPNRDISHIYQDRNHNIWVCTTAGLAKFHYRTRFFRHIEFFDTTGTPVNIRSIFKEYSYDTTLWIGTEANGLYKLNNRTTRITMNPPFSDDYKCNTINTIYRDNQHGLWLGTNSGIGLFTNSHKKHFSRYVIHPYQDITNGWRIWSIFLDKDSSLWIGTLREGLSRINPYKQSVLLDFQISGNTFAGPSIKAHEKFIPKFITNKSIFAIIKGNNNLIWIGSNQGLYCYNQQSDTFTHYSHRDNDSTGLSHNHVWYIHQAANGLLWLGTSGGGLNVLDPSTGKFRHYTEEDGLPSNIICGILEDDHGNLWISTNRGLSKFTPSTGTFRNFGIGDGLYISEFHFKTCFKDKSGLMYFGGIGGYIEFHPDSISINTNPPLLAFTAFKAFDKELQLDTSISHKKQVVLEHGDNYFSIEFTAFDFTNPTKNRFRYKLAGYDEQWRETDGSRPYASYTTVPPGTYTFHLQGSNSDGVWNTRGIQLSIVVLPAWWQTLWFRTGIALIVLCTLAGLAYWRYRHLKQRNLMEKKLVESQLQALRSQMNPHFIFNSLNSILHFITSNDAETAHIFLSKFSKLIRATLEHSRSEFILLSEELRLLSIYLELEALRFDNRFTYEIAVDSSIDIYAQQIPPLLIQPYVENAIKHGLIHTVEDGKLTISIRREDNHIICSVIDNGIGRQRALELKKQSVHRYISRGISLTKDRLDILNSIHSERYGVEINDLTDDSGYSRGTRVDIRISSKGSESVA